MTTLVMATLVMNTMAMTPLVIPCPWMAHGWPGSLAQRRQAIEPVLGSGTRPARFRGGWLQSTALPS